MSDLDKSSSIAKTKTSDNMTAEEIAELISQKTKQLMENSFVDKEARHLPDSALAGIDQ